MLVRCLSGAAGLGAALALVQPAAPAGRAEHEARHRGPAAVVSDQSRAWVVDVGKRHAERVLRQYDGMEVLQGRRRVYVSAHTNRPAATAWFTYSPTDRRWQRLPRMAEGADVVRAADHLVELSRERGGLKLRMWAADGRLVREVRVAQSPHVFASDFRLFGWSRSDRRFLAGCRTKLLAIGMDGQVHVVRDMREADPTVERRMGLVNAVVIDGSGRNVAVGVDAGGGRHLLLLSTRGVRGLGDARVVARSRDLWFIAPAAFSPDGRHLALTAQPDFSHQHVYIMRMPGGRIASPTAWAKDSTFDAPVWVSSTRLVALRHERAQKGPRTEVWEMRTSGGRARLLTAAP